VHAYNSNYEDPVTESTTPTYNSNYEDPVTESTTPTYKLTSMFIWYSNDKYFIRDSIKIISRSIQSKSEKSDYTAPQYSVTYMPGAHTFSKNLAPSYRW
jgi:hypothetical protein